MRSHIARYSLITIAICSVIGLFSSTAASAQNYDVITYVTGTIISVHPQNNSPGNAVTIKLTTGPHAGEIVPAETTGLYTSDITHPIFKPGDTAVVAMSEFGAGQPPLYSAIDEYRLPNAALLLVIVFIAAIIVAGWRGFGSLIGLGISLLVIGGFIIPQILKGHSPLTITLIGSGVIAALCIYLAHGFSRRTTLALASTYLTLILATLASITAVMMLHVRGVSSEDVAYLHQQLPALNIQGVLLAGMIISVLGVLDDVTVAQAAAVDELQKANPKLHWTELYHRALGIGREHIASLINTLVLAFVGASFTFFMYVVATLNLPLWLVLNSEIVMDEVVRSLVGSLALIAAIPIATLLAAYYLTHPLRRRKS